MKLIFLGTRGGIEEKNKKHNKHSSLLIVDKNKKLLIDFGEDWLRKLNKIKPNWILVTHSHYDHAYGLKQGTNIPVYCSKDTYKVIKKFQLKNLNIIKPYKRFKLGNFSIIPYKVIHSLIAPAFGYRITLGNKTLVYNSDLLDIPNKKKILSDVDIYIGDGASLYRGVVREKGKKKIGHCSIKTQLNWCKKYKIPLLIFTHFGKQIIEMNSKELKNKLRKLEKSIRLIEAYDNMKFRL